MIVVLGAGGTGRSVMAAIGRDVEAVFLDDGVPEGTVNGRRNAGPILVLASLGDVNPIVAFGSLHMRARETVFRELSARYQMAVAIHPSAVVDESASIAAGVYLGPLVSVMPNAAIGQNVIVCTHVSIDHDCVIGDHTYISPGVNLAGGVKVGASVFIGTNAVVLPLVTIGANAVIGAGAVVTKPVAAGATVAGVPARSK